jgi:hypothetical protein
MSVIATKRKAPSDWFSELHPSNDSVIGGKPPPMWAVRL